MVILIGGTGSTGKTALARQLQAKYNIPYVCLDHLMMALVRGLENPGFTPDDDQIHVGEVMWPVIEGYILTNIENEHSLIVEGFQLLPWHVRELKAAYPDAVLPIFMCLSEVYIEQNLDDGILAYRNVVETRGDVDDLTVDNLQRINKQFKGWCEEAGMTCFELDGSYEDGVAAIHVHVDEALAGAGFVINSHVTL